MTTPVVNWGYDLDALANAITPDTKLIFIANPNNPTGSWLKYDQFEAFLNTATKTILVISDEAYYDYAQDKNPPDTLALQKIFSHLIILCTFSKAYGLAGLRVGYCIANPEITDILNRIRLPFNVSSPALATAQAALADQTHSEKIVELNQQEMVKSAQNQRVINVLKQILN